ncbi:MAG: hypothetical protein C4551_10075 [Bacillota bacterium]|jgi:hypothetical protein|nr:MAG: hypothetical protein C4551_10075 [Bacillota bacterium]
MPEQEKPEAVEAERKTKLFIRPIDPDEEGSWRERKRYRQIHARMMAAQRSNDPVEILRALDEAEDFVVPRLATDDGTPVEEALAKLSANQFDALFRAAGASTVPPASASDSSSPSEGTPSSPPTG